MSVITNLVFIFVFLYIMFLFKVPDIENDSFILHKFFIFITLFIFNFVSQIVIKIRNNCKIEQYDLIYKSLETSVSGVIGYSLFIDLMVMEYTKDWMEYFTRSKYLIYLMACLMIIMFIMLIKIIKLMLNCDDDKCVKQSKTNIETE